MLLGVGVCLPVPGAGMAHDAGAAGVRLTIELARAAEAAGLATAWVPDGGSVDPVVLMGAIARRTSTAGVGLLVAGTGRRQPAVLAKEVTTVDVLAGGRAALALGLPRPQGGSGAGGGVDPEDTGARLRHAAAVCRSMFRAAPVTMTGPLGPVAGAANVPPPVRPGGPPLLAGLQDPLQLPDLAAWAVAPEGAPSLHRGPPAPAVDGLIVPAGGVPAVVRARAAVDEACAATGAASGGVAVVARVAWPDGGSAAAAVAGAGAGEELHDLVHDLVADVSALLAAPADGVIVDLAAEATAPGASAAAAATPPPDLERMGALWAAALAAVAAAGRRR